MEVVWTKFALDSLRTIYLYYKEKATVRIAQNIKNSILYSTRQLANHPLSGSKEVYLSDLGEGHRSMICGNYKITYKHQNKRIYITDIFDSRQNPVKLKDRAK
jgi:plasmid stabilization system protein ParE